jgi:O-methyltransferase involved in polyketide biosynthesis
MARTAVGLGPVPETTLWTLYHRAAEARRPDAVLADPLAIELVDRLDYPFAERFGEGAHLSQWQALRARCFDDAVRRFLREEPDGTVVALGEGLETQLWRVDNGCVHWVTVDLPEVVRLRRQLVPEHPRADLVEGSVLDESWLEHVPRSSAVLLTAQGLSMYLPPHEVHALVARCAERFPGGSLVFDAAPRWLVERSRSGKFDSGSSYEPPPWTWGLDRTEERRLQALPHVASLQRLRLPRGRGALHGWLLPVVGAVPGVRNVLLAVLHARFA